MHVRGRAAAVRSATVLAALCAGLLPAPCSGTEGRSAATLAAPVLKWQRGGCFSSWCQTGWYSSPAVADLDGDGHPEVIWGSYDVVALDGATGALKWRAQNGSRVWPGIAVADLTGDGTLEVIAGRGSDQLAVYDRNGNVLWARNPFGSGEVRTLAVEDLDTDGTLEIVVGRASGGATRQLNVYDAAGNVRPGWPARRDGEAGYGWGMYNENVAVADLDGDGDKELIGPTDTHYVTALDRGGNQLPANAIYGAGKVWSQVGVHVDHAVDLRGYANCGVEHRPNWADSAPVVGDLDGDGVREIVMVGNVYNCGTNPYTSLYQMPFVFRLDRTRASGAAWDWTVLPAPGAGSGPLSEDYDVIETVPPNPVLADLDGDGKKEILFPSYDGKVHAYWLDRTEHGSWPYDVPGTGIRFASEPAVADLDGDGHAEVLFTSWPQKSIGGTGQLHVLDDLGNLLYAVALPAPFGGATWNGALGAPTLADVDGDGELEVVVGTVASGAVVYDLPGTGSARVLWGTGRGGPRRTGAAPGPSGPPLAARFHTIAPCRLLDTRLAAGPLGGPSLAAGARRLLPLDGSCGIPPGARALSANLTVVAGGAAGFLVLWAGDGELPGTSNLNFGAGRVRANNAVIELARDGTRTLWVKSSSASAVDVILDVNGYFE
jgi:hypothetical protein